MFVAGVLRNDLIKENYSDYPLKDMINPTFQNEGTSTVFIDGRNVEPGQSYAVNAPNVILQNNVSITFEIDITKTRILFVGYVKTI